MPPKTKPNRIKGRGRWQYVPDRDPPYEYPSIRVQGPRIVAWRNSHQTWFDPAEAAPGQPCPAQRPGECDSILAKRVGPICLECAEHPLIRRGQLRAHISAWHLPYNSPDFHHFSGQNRARSGIMPAKVSAKDSSAPFGLQGVLLTTPAAKKPKRPAPALPFENLPPPTAPPPPAEPPAAPRPAAAIPPGILPAAVPGEQTNPAGKPPLWPHQEKALEFLKTRPAAMLAMAMGLGKSRVAIELLEARRCQRILILAPSSIVDYVWPQQLQAHGPASLRLTLLGPKVKAVKAKAQRLQEDLQKWPRSAAAPHAVIVNYESAWREPLAALLQQARFDLLILDESHRAKAPAGQMSRWVSRLARYIPNKLALTGTPMTHSPLDLYGQFRILDPEIFGYGYQDFKERYAIEEPIGLEGNRGAKIIGYQNMGELRTKFRRITFQYYDRRPLKLPERRHLPMALGLSPAGQKAYRALESDSELALKEGRAATAANAAVLVLRLQQLTSGFAVAEDDKAVLPVDQTKQKALTELLEALDPAEPVVVFARFRADLDAVAAAAKTAQRDCYELSGRRQEFEPWQAHPGGAALAAQIQSGSLGIDLTKACYAVYYSLDYNLGNFEQSLARLHRPGQTRPVQYYYLIAEDTIDQAVMRSLQKKRNLIQDILNEGRLRPQGSDE